MNKSNHFLKFVLFLSSFLWLVPYMQSQALLDPTIHSQFVNVITKPPVAPAIGVNTYNISMKMFSADLGLDGGLKTTMYGYNEMFPGPTILSSENVTTTVRFDNQLTGAHILPVDMSLHWANPANYPASGVPTITHLHGGHSLPEYDGYPDAWYTPGATPETGSHYTGNVNKYLNDQEETTLWYHDHAVGITRLNVYAGLEGFYLIQDKAWEEELRLPNGNYDIPLLFCDKSFYDNGELFYGSLPAECYQPNPSIQPEFFGDFNLVNGKVWPKMKVEPRKYRFRLLNGADSRFYNMSMDNGLQFIQIGSDGGFLDAPVYKNSVLLGPAERMDVIIDFSNLAVGTKIIVTNDANSPYPLGAPVDPNTSGQVMMFEVVPLSGFDLSQIPNNLRQVPLPTPSASDTLSLLKRQVTLSAIFDEYGRLLPLMGTAQHGLLRWKHPITENPQVGVPEIWQIINLTVDAHPIHLHQIMFQAIEVRPFNIDKFDLTGVIEYTGPPEPAPKDLKDTYIVPPGYIGLIKVNFDMEGLYVWHCHILSHEDFDMMRPLYVGDCANPNIVNNVPMEFLECGPVSNGTIGGYVWEDLNANGIKDPNEPGILNATVDIGTVPALNFVATTYTDANGMYFVDNLPTGAYFVTFANPGNYFPTLTNQGNNDLIDSDAFYNGTTDIIALSSGEVNMTVYNGYVPNFIQAPVLDPIPHPKFVNQLPIPPVISPTGPSHYYEVNIVEFTADLGIQDPNGNPLNTTMYGYNGMFPGPTFETQQNSAIKVKWINNLPTGANGAHILPLDQSIHWARPSGYPASGVPLVSHLHGGHTEAQFDGYPDAWYTPGNVEKGAFYPGQVYRYDNTQDPTGLWYHDHTIGITRLNINAGLEGFYFIRNAWEAGLNLPSGDYEIPLMLTDRSFREDGSLYFPSEPAETWIPNPSVIEEFFGDFNLVNGKVWPYLEVEPRKYRFRVLNGADGRFYDIALDNGMSFQQIGTDGGFLDGPVSRTNILMAPAERADIIIDFSGLAVGTNIVMTNTASAPFPMGGPPDPNTAGRIMQFRVVPSTGPDNSVVPPILQPSPIVPIDTLNAPHRQLTLTIGADSYGRLKPLQGTREHGGMGWNMPITENPQVGVPEVWEIINLTPDVHPIHLHQVMFQPLERRRFDDALFDATGQLVYLDPTWTPVPLEWKDTYQTPGAYVTRIAVEFDLEGLYVWHCHILSHEDHDMMRPMYIGNCNAPSTVAPVKFMDCNNTGANATVSGRVWEDLNCNGIRNPGEPWVENDYIEIISTLGFYVQSTYTNVNGFYSFSVPPGVYSVVMGNPGSYFVSPIDQGANDNVDSDLLFSGMTKPFAVAASSVANNIWGGFMLCDPNATCNLSATYTTRCDVNGTPGHASDDVYWIELTVNGGGANGWSSANSGYSGSYGVPITIGPLPIANGDFTIIIVDQSDPCCEIQETIVAPTSCPGCELKYDQYVWCENSGTKEDPSDDVFYVKFYVEGSPSGGWYTDNGYSGVNGNAIIMGPFLIVNGALDFTVIDNLRPGCNMTVHIDPPSSCSSECKLTYDYYVECSNNGTPNDPSDDVFSLKLVAFGGPSSTWVSSLGLTETYGNADVGGPYLISDGDLNILISDSQVPGCNLEVTIPAPLPCSKYCDLTYVYRTVCNDSGTPNDPSDDTFTLMFTANGGPSLLWQTSNGLSAAYGHRDVGGPYLISDGDLHFIVSDVTYPGCNIPVTIPAPAPCSNTCNLLVSTSPWCDNQGTIDPSDDVFFFRINVSGGPSSGWVSNIGINGTYGNTTVAGPYPAIGGGFTFTVLDSQYPSCNTSVSIDVPTNCGPSALSGDPDLAFGTETLDLKILKGKTSAELNWTSKGSVGDKFSVLRSTDGFEFQTIGSVVITGREDSFYFQDLQPKGGLNYYQVVASPDGFEVLKSNIVNAVFDQDVVLDKQVNISLYPNPAEDMVTIDLHSFKGQKVWVFVMDQLGKRVISLPVGEVAEDLINVEVGDLASGYYNVIIKAEEGLFASEKLIIIQSF